MDLVRTATSLIFLQTLGTACSVTQNHISEELNVQFCINIDCVNKVIVLFCLNSEPSLCALMSKLPTDLSGVAL